MKLLIVNPPHLSIGSRMPNEHLPPLGLLSIGGPLLDAGHEVNLLDADYGNLSIPLIVEKIREQHPDALLLGHSGSTSAQPIINEITKLVRQENAAVKIIIGGVFPTYHWKEILESNPQIDYIVCGEGEEVCLRLMEALDQKLPLEHIRGLAFNVGGVPYKTLSAETIKNLDDYRIGWELMEGYNYTYWGKKKAVVIQFSRGCPYPCTYCGQSLFWKKWRNRNPQLLADEIELLHKKYGIEVINFADENPSSNPKAWKAFLEALIAKRLNLILVGSIRADNMQKTIHQMMANDLLQKNK